MKEINYANIRALKTAIEKSEIKEEDLRITLDNDNVSFMCGDEEEDPDNFIWIEVATAGGYRDIKELYSLLFPKAKVAWC